MNLQSFCESLQNSFANAGKRLHYKQFSDHYEFSIYRKPTHLNFEHMVKIPKHEMESWMQTETMPTQLENCLI